MGLIFRQTKAGSPDGNYVPNVVIQSAEVNEDFNQLYTLVDGDLDNANIAVNANIDASKLNLTNAITTADLQDNAVTTQKIAPLAVTSAKLAIGATYVNNVVVPVPTAHAVTTAEVTLIDTPAFTTRNSTVLLFGSASFVCVMDSTTAGPVNSLTVRLYTCQPAPVFLTSFIATAEVSSATGGQTFTFPVMVPFNVIDTPGGGLSTFYRVTVQAQQQINIAPVSRWQTSGTWAGLVGALQLA